MSNDQSAFKRLVETMIAEERAQSHHVLALQLEENLRLPGNRLRAESGSRNDNVDGVCFEIIPEKILDELFLMDDVRATCERIIEEQHRKELLRSYGLEPRNRILVVGPPGNGKSSLAEALATGLMVPLLLVRYEGIIGSFLGETAVRLQKLFEYACRRSCVLFFDEFETLGKERGDTHETGEVKRVVSSLLLQIDRLPSHVVVIAATNHPEMLDRAVWRRFQVQFDLGPPDETALTAWLSDFERRTGLEIKPRVRASAARHLRKRSYAELEEFCENVYRRYVLSLPEQDLSRIVRSCIQEHSSRSAQVERNGK